MNAGSRASPTCARCNSSDFRPPSSRNCIKTSGAASLSPVPTTPASLASTTLLRAVPNKENGGFLNQGTYRESNQTIRPLIPERDSNCGSDLRLLPTSGRWFERTVTDRDEHRNRFSRTMTDSDGRYLGVLRRIPSPKNLGIPTNKSPPN